MFAIFNSKSRICSALLTTGANGCASLIKLVISAISISLLVSYLGTEKYGLVATIMSMMIWLSTIADGGGGLSLKNELIAENAKNTGNPRKQELIASTFYATMIIMVIIGVLATLLLEILPLKTILNIQTDISTEEAKKLILMSAWFILSITLFSLPRSIYSSFQVEYLFAPWSILGSILGLLFLWILIKKDFGLVPVGIAMLGGNVLAMFLATLWFQIYRKDLSFSLLKVKWSIIKKLARPGAAFFILQIFAVIIFQASIFIVNLFLGQSAAAIYSIHFQLFMYFQLLSSLIVGPFWSALGDAYHRKEHVWFKNAILLLIAGVAILFLIFSLMINIWGNEIMSIWTHHTMRWDPVLGLLLTAYFLILVIISIVMTALSSVGILKNQIKVVVSQGILTMVFSIYLVRLFGMYGVVWGALLGYFFTVMWYMPWKLIVFFKNWQVQRLTAFNNESASIT